MCGFKNSSDLFGLRALTPKLDEHVCGYVQFIRITFTANTQRKTVEMTIPINHCVNDNFDDRPEKTRLTNSEWKSWDRAARTACCCMVLYYHWSSFHIYLLFVGFKTRQSAHTRGFPLLDPGKVWKKVFVALHKKLAWSFWKKDQFL